MNKEEKILEVNNVIYEYRNKYQTVKAVNDFSFDFKRGKFYAIVGKSGSANNPSVNACRAGCTEGRLCAL